MDKEISDALSGLGDRMSHLESIHPDITYTAGGLGKSILFHLPLILITASITSVVVAIVIIQNKK